MLYKYEITGRVTNIEKYNNKFVEAISNDLNTSSMVTVLYDLLKDDNVNGNTKLNLIEEFDKVLSLDLLKEEVKMISDEGVTEVILTAQDSTYYGLDNYGERKYVSTCSYDFT